MTMARGNAYAASALPRLEYAFTCTIRAVLTHFPDDPICFAAAYLADYAAEEYGTQQCVCQRSESSAVHHAEQQTTKSAPRSLLEDELQPPRRAAEREHPTPQWKQESHVDENVPRTTALFEKGTTRSVRATPTLPRVEHDVVALDMQLDRQEEGRQMDGRQHKSSLMPKSSSSQGSRTSTPPASGGLPGWWDAASVALSTPAKTASGTSPAPASNADDDVDVSPAGASKSEEPISPEHRAVSGTDRLAHGPPSRAQYRPIQNPGILPSAPELVAEVLARVDLQVREQLAGGSGLMHARISAAIPASSAPATIAASSIPANSISATSPLSRESRLASRQVSRQVSRQEAHQSGEDPSVLTVQQDGQGGGKPDPSLTLFERGSAPTPVRGAAREYVRDQRQQPSREPVPWQSSELAHRRLRPPGQLPVHSEEAAEGEYGLARSPRSESSPEVPHGRSSWPSSSSVNSSPVHSEFSPTNDAYEASRQHWSASSTDPASPSASELSSSTSLSPDLSPARNYVQHQWTRPSFVPPITLPICSYSEDSPQ